MHIKLTTAQIVDFHRHLTAYYYESGRHDMAWRKPAPDGSYDPYRILVSEMMLQQTQVDRVTPKYRAFLKKFPTVKALAEVPLGEVLKEWSGLGYNRRAKYIWQAAHMIVTEYNGRFPETIKALQRIPGIGPNTAGAIMAYAYDAPVVFVETNIRTVLIHHFFSDETAVADAHIREILEILVPQKSDEGRSIQGAILGPRVFYWAMMDYGSHLKKTVGNVARASKHYSRQSKFHGSKRQIRGQVLRLLTEKSLTRATLTKQITDTRLQDVIDALESEGLITQKGTTLRLS